MVFLALFPLLLTGCAEDQTAKFRAERAAYYASLPPKVLTPRKTTFNESDYLGYEVKGAGTITGTAAVQRTDGQVIPGFGIGIMLLPRTDYTEEVVTKEFIPHQQLTPERDVRLMKYMHITKTNAEGKFRFDQVPPGTYFLYGRIGPTLPVAAGVTLTDGQVVDVLLTQ